MKLCYVVYREDNVMVFASQVLEYLQNLKGTSDFEQMELLVFRSGEKEELENRIHRFVDRCKTFLSKRVFSIAQLNSSAKKMKQYLSQAYGTQDEIAVICRGPLSAFVAEKAFKAFPNSRILFDNRGLPIEESAMRGDSFLHKLHRNMKKRVILYAKDHCDMYNFVTGPMRDYYIEAYQYSPDIPYTVIPTLYKAEPVDEEGFSVVAQKENYSPKDLIVSYVGSTDVWQSADRLVEVIEKIAIRYSNARFFILTNGSFPEIEKLSEEIRARIVVKGVPHSEIKYYLAMTDLGIVIRDDGIVNRVAAPTKITEYLTNGMCILYSGEIGILSDMKRQNLSGKMIHLDLEPNWLEQIGTLEKGKASEAVIRYFDMKTRQQETLDMIKRSMKNKKVR